MYLHIKKKIQFTPFDRQLEFSVAQSVFSSFQIDLGSQMLLRSLKNVNPKKILDLGCGYGTLGISLVSRNPDSQCVFADRDKKALALTTLNLQQNKTNGVTQPSLGFDEIEEREFDLIVSNIPAKAGEQAIKSFLIDGKFFLKKTGFVAVVVISRIADFVGKILKENSEIEIFLEKSNAHYTVFHFRYLGEVVGQYQNRFNQGQYFRSVNKFQSAGLSYELQTVWDLPEFDQIDWETKLFFENCDQVFKRTGKIENVLMVNSGLGHLPVFLTKKKKLSMFLENRDLLAEKTTNLNLQKNGFMPAKSWSGEDFDLAVIKLNEENDRISQVVEVQNLLARKKPQSFVVVLGQASKLSSSEKKIEGCKVWLQVKEKGHKMICFQ